MSQTVYMYKCTNSTLKVHGKVNSIVLGELEEGRGGKGRRGVGTGRRGGQE